MDEKVMKNWKWMPKNMARVPFPVELVVRTDRIQLYFDIFFTLGLGTLSLLPSLVSSVFNFHYSTVGRVG